MDLVVNCECGHGFKVPAAQGGHVVYCAKCEAPILVPNPPRPRKRKTKKPRMPWYTLPLLFGRQLILADASAAVRKKALGVMLSMSALLPWIMLIGGFADSNTLDFGQFSAIYLGSMALGVVGAGLWARGKGQSPTPYYIWMVIFPPVAIVGLLLAEDRCKEEHDKPRWVSGVEAWMARVMSAAVVGVRWGLVALLISIPFGAMLGPRTTTKRTGNVVTVVKHSDSDPSGVVLAIIATGFTLGFINGLIDHS